MAKLNRSDRDAFAAGSLAFALIAMVLAFAALVTAARSESRSNAANKRVAKLSGDIVLGSTAEITLQEYSVIIHSGPLKAGTVRLHVANVGSISHELVIIRAASAAALPKVKKAGERSVGAVNEEAIPQRDKMGETGDVAPRSSTTQRFVLPAGTYIIFCNIDTKIAGGTVFNHFVHGMVATLTVV
jgi:hypothetical protein